MIAALKAEHDQEVAPIEQLIADLEKQHDREVIDPLMLAREGVLEQISQKQQQFDPELLPRPDPDLATDELPSWLFETAAQKEEQS